MRVPRAHQHSGLQAVLSSHLDRQVSQENKQLKRISLALMPMLDQLPGDLLDLASKVESTPDAGPEPLQQLRGEAVPPTP